VQVPDTRFVPDKLAIETELRCKLGDSIALLPDRQRACFTLKYQDGLSVHEISGILGVNASTVKVHLFRAMQSLRDRMAAYAKQG